MTPPADDDPDALRRRLYRAGATDDDVARYRATAAPPAAPVRAPAAPAPPRRRRALPVLPVLLAVALVAGLVGVGSTVLGADAPVPSPRRTPDVELQPVPVSAAERRTLVAGLGQGSPRGLSDLFLAHPESIPAELRTTRRADTTEEVGLGSRTVDLDPSDLALHGGRITVVLVVDGPGTAEWRALRLASTELHSAAWRVMARGSGGYAPGLPRSGTLRYAAPAPTRLQIRVPRGVRWSATVTYTD